ncbi:MAG: iron donor protein CyaY [Alphaproteobacteria bacterium]|nr:iron donor protein CyaY [Alphaproteobacteria bacterium]
MDTTDFHARADRFLQALCDRIDEEGGDAELAGGVLTLTFGGGRQIVVNKHEAMQQIWVASPLSGGHHFSWDETTASWTSRQGETLEPLLERDIAALGSA